jgi:hypothetical protein
MATHIQPSRKTPPKVTTAGEKQYFPASEKQYFPASKSRAGTSKAPSVDTFESSAKAVKNPLYAPAGKSGEDPLHRRK